MSHWRGQKSADISRTKSDAIGARIGTPTSYIQRLLNCDTLKRRDEQNKSRCIRDETRRWQHLPYWNSKTTLIECRGLFELNNWYFKFQYPFLKLLWIKSNIKLGDAVHCIAPLKFLEFSSIEVLDFLWFITL